MNSLYLILCTVLLGLLSWAAWKDIKTGTLPILIMIILAAAGILLKVIFGEAGVLEILSGCIPGAIAFTLAYITRQAIGYGDAALITVTGIYLGLSANVCLVLCALVLSALTAIVLLVIKKKRRKDEMPFAPFMLGSYILMMAVNI